MLKSYFIENADKEALILNRANYLRGVFAILIVLGHCSMRFEKELLPLMLIHKANFIWVCFFFYVSGWSLAYNFDNKDNYLKNFVNNKLVKLFFLGLEAEIIGRLLKSICFKETFQIDVELLTGWNWYIYECLLMYLLYYIVYRYISNKRVLLWVIWIMSITFAIVFWALFNWGTWEGWTFAYYYSILSFPLGITQHYIFKANKYTIKNIWFLTIGAIIITTGSLVCVTMPQKSFLGGVILHNAVGCGFLMLFTIMLFVVDVKRIKCIRFLTRYASNIFFYQFCIMSIVSRIYQTVGKKVDCSYVLIVVFMTIVLSVIIDKINGLMGQTIKRVKGTI